MAYEQKKYDKPNPKGYAKGIMRRMIADGKQAEISLEYINSILEKKFNTVLTQTLFDLLKEECTEGGSGTPMMSEGKPKATAPASTAPSAPASFMKDAAAYLNAKGADLLLISKDGSVQLWTKTN